MSHILGSFHLQPLYDSRHGARGLWSHFSVILSLLCDLHLPAGGKWLPQPRCLILFSFQKKEEAVAFWGLFLRVRKYFPSRLFSYLIGQNWVTCLP